MTYTEERHTIPVRLDGVELRDYFATAALPIFHNVASWLTDGVTSSANADQVAANCYMIADAMLRARKRNDTASETQALTKRTALQR